MKLRDRDTGDEGELIEIVKRNGRFYLRIEDNIGVFLSRFDSLKELTQKWEDA